MIGNVILDVHDVPGAAVVTLVLVVVVAAGRVGAKGYEAEFKLLKKADLIKKDKIVTKLFQDSEKKTASYRFPTKPVDGIYTGCKKCNQKHCANAKTAKCKSHGGS